MPGRDGLSLAGGEDAFELGVDLSAVAASTPADAARIVRETALAGLALVKAKASGRPGPRVRTGDYRRSINVTFASRGFSYSASIGTNAPQARRLEFGFVGTDSLGRVVSQAPYPHWRPAAEVIEKALADRASDQIAQDIARLARRARSQRRSPAAR